MSYQRTLYEKNIRFKTKYEKIKAHIKKLVFENAALCDEVAQLQGELHAARGERRYLIKRLMRHEGFESIDKEKVTTTSTTESSTVHVTLPQKKRGPKKKAGRESNDMESINCGNDVGKPRMPINLYNILVHSLGEIISANSNFHNTHWIYPVGYVITRIYGHPKDPQRRCVYTCKILNNAGMPQFQIIPDNDLDSVFFGDSANICHQALLEAMQRSLSDLTKLPLRIQGEKFFGLTNSAVQHLLKLDTNIKHCSNFKRFLTPRELDCAIAEEKDPTINYEALQSLIVMSAYHTMPEVKNEPPDELFEVN